MNLNGWQRLSIVLFALWWTASLSLFLIEYLQASLFSTSLFVTHKSASFFSLMPLELAGLSSSQTIAEINTLNVAAAILFPFFLWALVQIGTIVTRWIAVGFELPQMEPPVLTNPISTQQLQQELINQTK